MHSNPPPECVTTKLKPQAACSSQINASVFGAQIAEVSSRRSLTEKLFVAGLRQPAMIQAIGYSSMCKPGHIIAEWAPFKKQKAIPINKLKITKAC